MAKVPNRPSVPGSRKSPSSVLDVSALLTLIATWVVIQVVGIIIGLTLIGRHGGGPARHLDVPVHDWFITHRTGLVGISKVIAYVGDAPKLGVIVVVATAIALLVGYRRGQLSVRALGPFVAFLGSEATVFAIRHVISRPRPSTADFPALGAVPGVHETSFSFPSGHATAVTAVLVSVAGLIAIRRKVRWPWTVAVIGLIVVAASRLVLGVHWTTDVLVGAILGGTWGLVVCWVQRRVPQPEHVPVT